MPSFHRTLLLLISIATLGLAGCASTPEQPKQTKTIYHINLGNEQASNGLRNIRNHLDVAPKTQIVVVTHAEGIDFLREGAKDKKNADIDYNALVNALKSRGVRFEICEITITGAGLKKDQFTMDADFVPSGVARITELQTREGFAYIKP